MIGPYKLLQKIGEGGMGVVFMAEQEKPVRRKVAIKVIKPGMDTGQVIACFEAERQALAIMDHPHIARVLDAGATDTGRPYFVMELVKGVPITEYCDRNHLTPKERLELFIPACQAIQHAHQKGIIHRDIKPTNVLVTLYDGRPIPKVIDFGVAKAIDQRLTERTLFTEFGAVIGTLEYMSPEQAEMGALDIDTRSDIYALGVLLYELLTGSTPLERAKLRQAAFVEILRRIREEEATKPSTRLSESRDSLPSISAQRKMEPGRLTRLVRGDLDRIVMKSLEKDRTRRYETAAGFARDIRRYLDGDPVEACPPSTTYKLRKFARKHRAALMTIGAFAFVIVAALVAVVAALAVGNLRVARQRDRAEQNLTFARTVVDEMYTQVALELERSERALPEQRMILEKALRFYERFAVPQSRDPEILFEAAQAGIRLGKIQRWLREYRKAEDAARDALTILSRLATDHPSNLEYRVALAQAHSDLGVSLLSLSRGDEGGEELIKAAEIFSSLAAADATRLRGYAGLLEVFSRYKTAPAYIRDSIEARGEQARTRSIEVRKRQEALINRELPGMERSAQDHPDDLRFQEGLDLLAYEQWNDGSFPRDARFIEQGLLRGIRRSEDIVRERPGSADARHSLAQVLRRLGFFYQNRSDHRHSSELLDRSIAILEKLRSEHPDVPQYVQALAHVSAGKALNLAHLKKYAESQELELRAIDHFRSAHRLEPLDSQILNDFEGHLANLAEVLNHQCRYREALPLLEEALALRFSRYRDVHQLFYALTAARLGDLSHLERHEAAIRATLDDRVGVENAPRTGYWITHFDAACVHAALARPGLDGQTATADRRRIARTDYEHALGHLEKARAAGDFKGITSLDEIRRDPTLDILRSDTRFRILMMDLSFPDDPFRN